MRRSLGGLCLALALAVIGAPFAFGTEANVTRSIGGAAVSMAFFAGLVSLIALAVELIRGSSQSPKPGRGVRAKRIGGRIVAAAAPLYVLGAIAVSIDSADWAQVLFLVGSFAFVALLFVGLPMLMWGVIHAEPAEAVGATMEA